MFDKSFAFTKTFHKEEKSHRHLKSKSVYQFKSDIQPYIIEVEVYAHNIHVIKFFPKKFKSSPKKFNMLTHENIMGPIIGTCIRLVLQILKNNSLANFGFLGSHTINLSKKYIENKECTKRFRVYRYAVFNLIGEDSFSHFMEERNSTYLLVNNKNENVDEIKTKADSMFEAIFPELVGN